MTRTQAKRSVSLLRRGNRSFAETSPNGGVAPKPDIGLDTIALPLDPGSETLPKTP